MKHLLYTWFQFLCDRQIHGTHRIHWGYGCTGCNRLKWRRGN